MYLRGKRPRDVLNRKLSKNQELVALDKESIDLSGIEPRYIRRSTTNVVTATNQSSRLQGVNLKYVYTKLSLAVHYSNYARQVELHALLEVFRIKLKPLF